MRKVNRTEIINCDFCNDEIQSTFVEGRFIVGHVGQGTDMHAKTITVSMKGVIPYCTGDADICDKCASKFLINIANKIKKPLDNKE